MKRFNKFLALFLVVVMAVGLLPAGVTAAANSNVIFKEDFEDYTSIIKETANKDRFVFDQYWESGEGELAEDVGHDSEKSALLTSTTYKTSGPSWSSAQYGFGRFIILLDASQFEAYATYKISAWFKTSSTGLAKFTVQANGQAAQLNVTNQSAYPLSSADGWVQKELVFVMPAGVTASDLRVVVGGDYPIATNDAQIWIDDISIEKVKDVPNPNDVIEEGFELNSELPVTTLNGNLMHEAYWGGGAGQIVTNDGHNSDRSVKLTATAHSNSGVTDKKYSIGRVYIDVKKEAFEVGVTYVASAWFKASSANTTVNINVLDSNYAANGENHDIRWHDVGTEWVRKEVVFTVKEDVGATIKFRFGASTYHSDNTPYLMVDDIRITKYYVYESLTAELAAGDAKLLTDVDGTGKDLVLQSGKTLDLAGYTLTVDSLTALKGANVIDSVGGGKLVVAENALLLQKDNSDLPVKVDGGYAFVSVKNQHEPKSAEAGSLIYSSRPSLGDLGAEYLADGAADNGLTISFRLTWTNASNGTTTMDVPCSEEKIQQVYSQSGNAFELTVSGVDKVEDLKIATVVTSDTGVTVVGEYLVYVAG